MKKMITLLLALVMVISLIPMSAMAALKLPANKLPDFSNVPVTQGKPDLTTKEDEHKKDFEIKDITLKKDNGNATPTHNAEGDEIVGIGYDTKYHWQQCACGCKIGMELHVDPKDAVNDYCTCGYHFSDNADLVTLWVDGCPPIKNFDKNTTEYKLNAYTYKDVKEIKISTRTYDSEATVELPEDLTLKAGENKFDVKVTSENQKVTKIYTLIVTK